MSAAPFPHGDYIDGRFCSAGLVSHKWRRVAGPSRDGSLRCGSCKHQYDGDFMREEGMNTTDCPKCGGPLKPPMTWHRECVRCGATS